MKRLHLLQLFRSKLLSRRSIQVILKKDPSLQKITSFSSTDITSYFNIPSALAKKVEACFDNDDIMNEIKKDEQHCHIITIFDKDYPKLLKQIVDAPLVLYGLGDKSLLNTMPIISVIGTRNPSKNAWTKLDYVTTPLIENGWTIVSGLAKGIDSFAHKLTLNHSGKTIAVLGSGFNHIYPKENSGLYELIKNRGLVITEYPPHTPPRKYQFPERNRIISGLSLATVVIEAKKRSGTLITVSQALEQGRDVYAVPDSPFLEEAEGCHELIQDGAQLITSSSHILEDWTNMRQQSFF